MLLSPFRTTWRWTYPAWPAGVSIHPVDVPKFCTLASGIPSLTSVSRILVDVRRLGIADLHYRAASKIDAQIQSLGEEKKYRDNKSQQRNGGGIFPPAHEGNIALDSEKFHPDPYLPLTISEGYLLILFTALLYICISAYPYRLPDLANGDPLQLATAAIYQIDQPARNHHRAEH